MISVDAQSVQSLARMGEFQQVAILRTLPPSDVVRLMDLAQSMQRNGLGFSIGSVLFSAAKVLGGSLVGNMFGGSKQPQVIVQQVPAPEPAPAPSKPGVSPWLIAAGLVVIGVVAFGGRRNRT